MITANTVVNTIIKGECLPWHQDTWQQWFNQWRSNKMPHAILLESTQGMGKSILASYWAQFLLCTAEEKTNTQQPCSSKNNSCKSCKLFLAGNHPDFYYLRPEEKSKVIKVNQVRELTHSLSQTAQCAKQQVVVIECAEQLNSAAANSLLKTLEEPIGEVYFILLTETPGRLMPTLVSRCQRYQLSSKDSQVLEWMQVQGHSSEQAQVLLSMAQGAPLQAIELAKEDIFSLRDMILGDLTLFFQGKTSVIYLAKRWGEKDLHRVIDILYFCVLDFLKLNWNCDVALLHNSDCAAGLTRCVELLQPARLLDLLEPLQQTRLLLNTAANDRLLMEELLINWHSVRRLS